MKTQEKHLYYLSELSDYKIAGGYPDIRDWVVKDSALRTVGKVKNLLVNPRMERVVYLDVEVDHSIIDAKHDPYGRPANTDVREFINEEGENHVIIPIGLVELNEDQEYVFAESIDHQTFAETKRKRGDTTIDRDYEAVVMDSYTRSQPETTILDEQYSDDETHKIPEVDSDGERLERIKKRDHIGEYRTEGEKISDKDDVDWYDAENEGLKSPDQVWEEDEFYRRSEFDDARFRRRRK
jgi:hypothetical protein